MRVLFGMLLVLSLLLLAAIQWGGALVGTGKSSPGSGEMNPEKIKLLEMPPARQLNAAAAQVAQAVLPASAPATAAALPAPVLPAAIAPAPHPASPAVQPAAPSAAQAPRAPLPVTPPPAVAAHPAVQAAKPAARLCVEWGEFSGTDLGRAEKALAAMKLGDRLSQHTVEYDSGYWVYIPPLRNKAAINKKIAELKAAGIEEYFVLKEARKWHNAISLGVFKSEESARQLLAAVKKKGVHSAKLGVRKGKLKYIVFRIKDLDADGAAHLGKLQKDFGGSELKKTACHPG